MSLFQCENCGCIENTALSMQGFKHLTGAFSWEGIEKRKGLKLCSACGPSKHKGGVESGFGKWHDFFNRVYLPKGEFKTNRFGNIEHIKTGDTDLKKYILDSEQEAN